MDENLVKDKIRKFVCACLGVEPSFLSDDTSLFSEEVALDSIDLLDLISYIDQEFDVDMSSVNEEVFDNVNSITKYIIMNK
jgi:acyl carrier protein